jgi:Domain of unknown function (DUF1918)
MPTWGPRPPAGSSTERCSPANIASHVGEPPRDGEVLEVLGEDGAPPYLVRWEADADASRFYPSSAVYVENFDRSQSTGGEKTSERAGGG